MEAQGQRDGAASDPRHGLPPKLLRLTLGGRARPPRTRGRRPSPGASPRRLGALGLGLLLLAGALGAADDLEYPVKAAFLYKFAKFVRWPQTAPDPDVFVVGVIGEDPFGEALDRTLARKSIGGKTIAVRRFASARDLAPCHILFVSRSEDQRVDRILGTVPPGTLTVGETRAFDRAGGMIRFVLRGGKVRFEIDQAAAERAGLEISSQLLSVASAVRRGS